MVSFFFFCRGNNFSFCQRTTVTGEILYSVRRGFEDLSGCFVPGSFLPETISLAGYFFNEFLLHSFPKKHCFLNEVNAKALE